VNWFRETRTLWDAKRLIKSLRLDVGRSDHLAPPLGIFRNTLPKSEGVPAASRPGRQDGPLLRDCAIGRHGQVKILNATASFLCHDVAEVRAKMKELGLQPGNHR
jgi:hypothetical protein